MLGAATQVCAHKTERNLGPNFDTLRFYDLIIGVDIVNFQYTISRWGLK